MSNKPFALRDAKNEPPRDKPNPAEDGVVHINIYTKGATKLGRDLSHFNHAPFTHPVFGPFQNMEGYWHWIKSNERPDELRYMVGLQAKNFGKQLTKEYMENFQDLILEGNFCKIVQNPAIEQLLLESTLPFDHYYLFGDAGNQVPIRPRSCDWLAPSFAQIRDMLRNNQVPAGLVGMKIKS